MSMVSEEKTKGITSDKLKNIKGYPSKQNTESDDITWFKEDSYKGTAYNWLSKIFDKATKKQTLESKGTPDFIVAKKNSDTIVVIECKGDTNNHSRFNNLDDYKKNGYGKAKETEVYAIDGALWYASFLCDDYDVIAIAVSGQNTAECRVTSFVWPNGSKVSDIEIIEDGSISNSLVSINQYEEDVFKVLNRFASTEDEIRKELRRYTLACANFLRSNGIEDNSKAGFVSAVVLGLTNHESKLYELTKLAIDNKRTTKSQKMIKDIISKDSIKMLKTSLYGDGNEYDDDYIRGVWDIDGIPPGKRKALKTFYNSLLIRSELMQAPKGKDNKYFTDGDTVLSCCIFSLYENVIEVLEKYKGIDVMGEFYTTFLRFTKGNAKEKGIVLTPKHITELFCDIAEYYLDEKFNEQTKIIDICCGSGAFLISALTRIKNNIKQLKLNEHAKEEKCIFAQKNSLIGVERDPSMYALAYANMRFHGDGKSNLFNCSSLLMDSYAPIDDSGKTYLTDTKVPLNEALQSFGNIDVGMINPPYSLDKKDNSVIREYSIINEINAANDKIKNIKKSIKDLKKKEPLSCSETEILKLEQENDKTNQILSELEKKLKDTQMNEVVIQKGQDELDFIASMLHYIKLGGIGIAIVPMSCAGNSGTKLRAELLKHHTLLACMTMPNQLFFDSHVGTATCIMAFKAHIPHDENKSVFFARWQDDGFKVIPHNGRKDIGLWKNIRLNWIEQLDGSAKQDDYVWLKKKIKVTDEALAEAYIKTDYSNLSDDDFKITLKKFSLYKYMEENGLLEV